MTRRTVLGFATILLILLTLIVAICIDCTVVPLNRFVSAPFTVPVLIAAGRLSIRAAIVTAILVFAVALVSAFSAYQSGALLLPLIFHLLSLLEASTLAILLGHQYRNSARLARGVQDARNTQGTNIETLPAGVPVTDVRGTITLANTAETILGGRATGTAYGPPGGDQIKFPNGTAFPTHDLPLRQATECGEATRDVEIRVLRHAQPIQVDDAGSIPSVLADSARIEQVLGNVLSNAAKYGDPNAAITVTVCQQDDTAVVGVTNRGPGIPADDLTKLFALFYRTDKQPRSISRCPGPSQQRRRMRRLQGPLPDRAGLIRPR